MRPAHALNLSLALGIIASNPLRADYEVLRGDLFGRVTTRAEADSNIYLNNLETADFIFTFIPEVGFKRDVALVTLDMSAGLNVQRFLEHAANNAVGPFASALVGWAPEGGKSSGQFLASARQVAQADPNVNQRTVSDNYLLDGMFGHSVTEKFGYRFESSYLDQVYRTPGLSNVAVFQSGLETRLQYSPKLESILGYNFRDTTRNHRLPGLVSVDSLDHQFLLGLNGELLPKVTGRVVAGMVTRRYTRGDQSKSALLLDSSLKWQWKESITVILNARRDFDTSPIDQSILRSSFGLAARIQMTAKIDLSGECTYSYRDYTGGSVPRNDRIYGFNTACVYSFTPRVQGRAFANYLTSISTTNFGTYDRVLVGLSAGVKL